MKHLFWLLPLFVMACTSNTKVEVVEDQATEVKVELPSWNDGDAKQRILDFVHSTCDEASADHIAPKDRVAVFDNDGTLWSEQPMYFQLFFVFDRIKDLASDHPEWQDEEPFKSVLNNDMKGLMASGKHGLIEILMQTHAGMTTEEFNDIVSDWVATAKHPETGKLYTEMVFQPMLEVIDLLQENDFEVYIVSGGGIEFMRPWTARVYNIPAENVVGSSIKVEYEMTENGPVLNRLPDVNFIDDKEGKPVGIHYHIGKRPVMAFGNSVGDLQMLEWTAGGNEASLCTYIHHTDSEREYAYDRDGHIGVLDSGLVVSEKENWLVVDMAKDWKSIWPE